MTVKVSDVVRFENAVEWNKDTLYEITAINGSAISFVHYGNAGDGTYEGSVEALKPYVVDPSQVSETLTDDERIALLLSAVLESENGLSPDDVV